ncbi:hypothetical protein ACTVZO_00745 [Streptomyces sp. IBSNAI002]|uniref:hypothetical protein n=1 Tax=Streptomyces sp. IBSNAI002 TaxID=3457500 RepID=UPI003FD33958
MRTAFTSLTTVAAAVAAIGILGLQSAQAEPSQTAAACAVQPQQTVTTADHYALTNLRAVYRTDAPKTNGYASYRLAGEPQGCTGGVFFAVDVLTGRLVPIANGATSTPDWNTVTFRMAAGQRLVQVMYGDPATPWTGTFLGSAAKLLP